jgi:hypothetical protein
MTSLFSSRAARLASSFTFLVALWAGCSATGKDPNANASGTGGSSSASSGGGEGGIAISGGTGGAGTGAGPTAAHLKGKVVAPEGTIPISGALVYVDSAPPSPVPDGVYCDQCVHLDDGIAFTTTAPDGSFDLGTDAVGEGYLVVQKGAFRRVRKLSVQKGDQEVPKELTTMPAKMDKANGDDIPKIAIVLGAWDPIEIVLARMGLEAKITNDFFGKAQVLSADATSFAIYGLHGFGEQSPHPPPMTLLTTPSEIEKYHMVFIPCSGGTNFGGDGPACEGVFPFDPKVNATLDGFVKKGGRVYASDWSYEYVRQVFPGFVSWEGESGAIGSACKSGGGDQAAPPVDPGLAAWLSAQGQTLDTVKDAWTSVAAVHPTQDQDASGNPVTETPKVWVHADADPATTSFKHGCGRVLYTTYHTQPTSETNGPLEPQALSLLYLILEIGVCVDEKIPG